MKFLRIYLPVIFLLSTFSCKKFVEDQKQKAAMSFITEGNWKIESYLIDTASITSEFEGYKFKFNDDGSVDGTLNSETHTGTWLGDVRDYSITSEFPGSGAPLERLNGKWIIKDSGTSYVKADLSIDSVVMHLHLTKIL